MQEGIRLLCSGPACRLPRDICMANVRRGSWTRWAMRSWLLMLYDWWPEEVEVALICPAHTQPKKTNSLLILGGGGAGNDGDPTGLPFTWTTSSSAFDMSCCPSSIFDFSDHSLSSHPGSCLMGGTKLKKSLVPSPGWASSPPCIHHTLPSALPLPDISSGCLAS